MRKKRTGMIILTLLLFSLNFSGIAQEVTLDVNDSRNRQTVTVKLYDNNEGGFLLDLPLTFHLNRENILFMIVGDDNEPGFNNTVWMFDKTVALADFLKKNKQAAASKLFKKQTARLERFFDGSENIEKHAFFDNGFEIIKAAPKPAFFRILDPAKPVILKLRFYIAASGADGVQTLASESGQIKITVNIQK